MIPDQSLYFLINSRSGGRRARLVIRDLRQLAMAQPELGIVVEELNFAALDQQIDQARVADIVVIGGGDGTVSSLLGKFSGSKARVGILPLGTGNDLARELGMIGQFRMCSAIEILNFYRSAASRELTLGLIEYGNGFSAKATFVNYVSFGFDAKVVTDFARWRETRFWSSWRSVWWNRLGYVLACFYNLGYSLGGKPTISKDGLANPCEFAKASSVIFANIQSIMGLGRSNLTGSAFDNEVEGLVVDNFLGYGSMLLNYYLTIFSPSFLGSAKVWELTGLPESCQVQIDGEPRLDVRSTRYRIRTEGKVRVLIGVIKDG